MLDLDLTTGDAELRKRQPVLGGYDPSPLPDLPALGERRRRRPGPALGGPPGRPARRSRRPAGNATDDPAPCLLYGYGAYEHSVDPVFSSLRLSLLDRGFVFAIAHVRGGGELGRRWYESGKPAAKPHTFSDFVACARHLVAAGFTAPDRLAARGGSAGGLLMGAVVNQAPELFRAVVAEVPFVDCLTTMMDDTLPLTVGEWEEWGNPVADLDAYAAMKGYSPYDNVRSGHQDGTPVRHPTGAGDRRAARPPGGLLGAGQMGCQAAGGRPRQPGPVPDRAGSRPRRALRPLRRLAGRGARVRVRARRTGPGHRWRRRTGPGRARNRALYVAAGRSVIVNGVW